MGYLRFMGAHRSLLGFGLLTAFSTSFGQTFFISLFLPAFRDAFQVTDADFGMMYGAATLLSALLLPSTGGQIDGASLKRYTTATMAGLTVAVVVVASSLNVWMLAVGLLGLRLFGPGLLGHISHTVMAREFGLRRGKALGVAGIGYPLGEALLPIVFASLLLWVPWRGLWAGVAILTGALLLPLLLRLAPVDIETVRSKTYGESFGRRTLWRDHRLLLVLPSVVVLPFVLTGLFLYQTSLATSKGWPLEWMAAAFSSFAVVRMASSVTIGSFIDRLSATRLLPFYMLPLAAGLGVLGAAQSRSVAFFFMVAAGLTAGANGSIASAVWAELYGPANVGKVRSIAAALAVFSTAASPALMGWMFRAGVSIETMIHGSMWLVLAASALSVPVMRGGRPPELMETGPGQRALDDSELTTVQ